MRPTALIAAIFLLLTSACGGGGTGGSLDATPPTEPPAKPAWGDHILAASMAWGTKTEALPSGDTLALGLFNESALIGAGRDSEQPIEATGSNINGFLAKVGRHGDPVWSRVFQSPGLAQPIDVAVAPDGAIYVVGAFTDALTLGGWLAEPTTLQAVGSQDAFVCRLDAEGAPVWVRQLATTSLEQAMAVDVRPDGRIVVSGVFQQDMVVGAGEPGETILDKGPGSDDAFLACFEATDGEVVWATSVKSQDGGFVSGWSTVALSDGSVALSGHFAMDAVFGAGEATERVLSSTAATTDVFVARYAADGTLLWTRQGAGGGKDFLQGVTEAPDGRICALGRFQDAIVFEGPRGVGLAIDSAAPEGCFVMCYDLSGAPVRGHRVAEASECSATDVCYRSDGSYAVSGWFRYEAVFGRGGANETTVTARDGNDYDGFVALFAPAGELLGVLHLDGTGYDACNAVAAHADDGVVMTGVFQEGLACRPAGGDATMELLAGGLYDGFLFRLHPQQEVESTESTGEPAQ